MTTQQNRDMETIEKQIWENCKTISDHLLGIVGGIHVDGEFNDTDDKQEFTVYTSSGSCLKVWREVSYSNEQECDRNRTGDENGWYYDVSQPFTDDGFIEIPLREFLSDLRFQIAVRTPNLKS